MWLAKTEEGIQRSRSPSISLKGKALGPERSASSPVVGQPAERTRFPVSQSLEHVTSDRDRCLVEHSAEELQKVVEGDSLELGFSSQDKNADSAKDEEEACDTNNVCDAEKRPRRNKLLEFYRGTVEGGCGVVVVVFSVHEGGFVVVLC